MNPNDTHHNINLNVRGTGESATLRINDRVRELRKSNKLVYNFGLGQSPFPVPKPVVDTLRLHAGEKDYLPVRGLPALREAVANFHHRLDQVETTLHHVIVGPGSKELMFLLQIAFYGELILPSPCWVSYGPQARILGKKIGVIPTTFEDRWRLTAKSFDAFLREEADDDRPRILVLNYPGNPDGLTYTADELQAIGEVARNYNVIILSDEIYGQIHHSGGHISIARYYPEGTILSSGISKWCGAGGWRLGTMTFPENLRWLMNAMADVASETYTSVSAPIQYAAVTAFKGGIEIERYLRNSRRILAKLCTELTGVFSEAGISFHKPEGAFYFFLDFEPFREKLAARGITTSSALCEALLNEASVAVLPGKAFERPGSELTLRLSYVNFDGSAALAASESTPPHEKLPDDYCQRYCVDVGTGATKIVEWLNN